MSKLVIFNGLKSDLAAVTGIKHVALWNNQLERENVENAFLYPAIFIEFLPATYTDNGNRAKSQGYEMDIRLHICLESYKDEDTDILTLVDLVWNKVHKKTYGDSSQLLRRSEEQSFDHSNIQDFMQDYHVVGTDALTADTTTATLSPIINPIEIVLPSEL